MGLSLDSLYAANEAINDTNDIETNQKVVNGIYLYSLIDSADYSSEDTTVLTEISQLKTAVGGKAVYQSRAMLFLEVHEIIPELRVMNAASGEIVSQQTQIKKNQLKIFPNPTSQTLFVEKNSDFEIIKIELLNTVGETLFVTTTEFNSIQIGWLSPGMYLLKAIDSEGKIWHSSFAKID